ncbi:hypothetical protein BC828DRAFT_409532 [Blastocladiella britannica]|nr:hypothetical protein BC828DRAFT_409532 [Blastocladiella britannica]
MRFSVAAILCVFVAGVAATAPVAAQGSNTIQSCPEMRQCYSQCWRACKGDDDCYNSCTNTCSCNW